SGGPCPIFCFGPCPGLAPDKGQSEEVGNFQMSVPGHFTPPSTHAKAALTIAPLSRQEINHSITAGLGCDFSVHGHPFLLVVGGEALLKPDGHLLHLTLDNEQSLAISNYGGTFGNGDMRILVDRDAKPFARGEESQNYRARLTVRCAGRERTVTRVWTCGA
uniref:hypothetical protein n=1 Tax=Sphingomonas bacterium TaxID=1895847 RepID=UPI00261BB6E9